jgi:glutathione S-transferase
MMITVFGRATSSNVQMVMWAVAELGLEHKRLDYGHIHGGTDSAEFLAMNPRGRVPVLKDGDLVIWESAAILRYLAAAYGQGGSFWPADAKKRARVDMWAEWGKNELSQAFTVPIFWSRVRTPAAMRNQKALESAIAVFEAHLDLLESQLSGREFILGDGFTVADIVIGHLLFRWFDMDIPRRPRPEIERYYESLVSRPAYQSHVMISYGSLQAEGA